MGDAAASAANPESRIPYHANVGPNPLLSPGSLSLLRFGFGLRRWLGPLPLRLSRARLALHVDAAAEMRTLGDGDARRDDVAVDRPGVADVDLVAGGDVARGVPEHDHRLRGGLRLD